MLQKIWLKPKTNSSNIQVKKLITFIFGWRSSVRTATLIISWHCWSQDTFYQIPILDVLACTILQRKNEPQCWNSPSIQYHHKVKELKIFHDFLCQYIDLSTYNDDPSWERIYCRHCSDEFRNVLLLDTFCIAPRLIIKHHQLIMFLARLK